MWRTKQRARLMNSQDNPHAGTQDEGTTVLPSLTTEEKQQLDDFANAVRAKEDWFFEIFADQGRLLTESALEANLLENGDSAESRCTNGLTETIEELKSEAHRIHALDHNIRLQSPELPSRPVDWGTIDAEVRGTLERIATADYTAVIYRPPMNVSVGVYVSDGITPPSLHRELVKELDALAAIEPKDMQPGANGTVQNLINPSLYPYVAGESPVEDSAPSPPLENGKFKTAMFTGRTTRFESPYAWIPSVFRVSDDGTDVHIESYINGLGPRERYPVLYGLLEKMFALAIPHLERTLRYFYRSRQSTSVDRWAERLDAREGTSRCAWRDLLDRQEAEKPDREAFRETEEAAREIHAISSHYRPVSLNGHNHKVIVRAVNYTLKPGQEYEGTWHFEGMWHERIVASAMYYYDTDEKILDDGLSFRKFRDTAYDFPDVSLLPKDFRINFTSTSDAGDDTGNTSYTDEQEEDYPSDWETEYAGFKPMSISKINMTVPLGTVPTSSPPSNQKSSWHETGRILSLPNWVQHKIPGIRNCLSSEEMRPLHRAAQRKVLCFFLVQETGPVYHHGFNSDGLWLRHLSILTTADVPSQERICNLATIHFLLTSACHRLTTKNFPPELINIIIDNMGYMGVKRATVEQHRHVLMADRSVKYARIERWDEFWAIT